MGSFNNMYITYDLTKRFLIKDSETGQTIPWRYNLFPDGQLQFVVLDDRVNLWDPVIITCSILNSVDLDIFLQMLGTFRLIAKVNIRYLYGARSDKEKDVTTEQHVSVAGNMVLALIQQLRPTTSVTLLHPHNYASIKDNINVNLRKRIQFYLPNIIQLMSVQDAIVFPDKSARSRVEPLIDILNEEQPDNGVEFHTIWKERDNEGNIIDFDFDASGLDKKKYILVLDDLCDGGATFLRAGEAIREVNEDAYLTLFVTHGLFTDKVKRTGELYKYYDRIVTTDSVPKDLDFFTECKAPEIMNVWNGNDLIRVTYE